MFVVSPSSSLGDKISQPLLAEETRVWASPASPPTYNSHLVSLTHQGPEIGREREKVGVRGGVGTLLAPPCERGLLFPCGIELLFSSDPFSNERNAFHPRPSSSARPTDWGHSQIAPIHTPNTTKQ